MKNTSKIFVIITFIIFISGCSKNIDRSMVIGKYVANHNKGIDTLEVKEDGTYRYYFQDLEGNKYTNSNKWEFEYFEGKAILTFWNFSFEHPREGLPEYLAKTRGFWGVYPKTSLFGKIRLSIDPDWGHYYEKIEE